MISNFLIAKTAPDVIMPTKRPEDGCYDLYAYFPDEFIAIQPHTVKLIPTGIKSAFNQHYRIAFRERGSNIKSCMIVMAGQIDSSYRGEWFVAIYNGNDKPIEITKNVNEVTYEPDFIRVPYGKAIAQFAIEEVPDIEPTLVDEYIIDYLVTERGDGKLGSSGK
jgi:dUTP pyrophosphatase